jgi:hypothetical protein
VGEGRQTNTSVFSPFASFGRRHRKGTHMDRALSFLISAGIAAFGVWIIAYSIVSGSYLVWTFMGILPIVVGLISLYQTNRSS